MPADIALALVIPAQHRALFERAASGLSGVALTWLPYASETDVAPLLEGTQRFDAVFFAGPMAYDRSKAVLPQGVPVSVARLKPVDLALALFRALAAQPEVLPVSIDTFDAAAVAEVAAALQFDPTAIFTLPYAADQTADEIVTFHLRAQREHATRHVITGRNEVYRRLQAEGHQHVQRVIPVLSTIQGAINEVVLKAETARIGSLRFAAALFHVLGDLSPQHAERAQIELMHVLLNTPELSDAWVEARGTRGVLVFAHMALLEQFTDAWTNVPILDERSRAAARLAAGFGFGTSARSSVSHAEQAVRRAEQDGGDCGYLIGDDGLMIGPMSPWRSPLSFRYEADGGQLHQLARELGLSVATVSRLLGFERRMDGRATTAEELAAQLRITPPSGRRLVRLLRERGMAHGVGMSQPSRRGRPRRFYRLDLAARLDASAKDGPDSDRAPPTSGTARMKEDDRHQYQHDSET